MEQEIWHDDLYATREKPVKPRAKQHKSCVKFADKDGLQPSEILVIKPQISVSALQEKYKSLINEAVYLESHIDKNSVVFVGEINQVISAYTKARDAALTDKQVKFCDNRIQLCFNMKTMWR
jgi:hypothetical protein